MGADGWSPEPAMGSLAMTDQKKSARAQGPGRLSNTIDQAQPHGPQPWERQSFQAM